MVNPAARVKFVRKNLLGRKREPTVRVVSAEEGQDQEGEEEDIVSIMKEIETDTTIARDEVIAKCQSLYREAQGEPELDREQLKRYLDSAFSNDFPPQMVALDASQPWILYWTANSLKLLDEGYLSDRCKRRICEKLFAISESGGPFGGGVGQLPHLASTYAAVSALALCDNVEGYWDRINEKAIYDWLLSLKQPDGGFRTCRGVGETDTRGVYCALSIASLLNILTDELCEGVANFLVRCQTYEGGFGGCPHGDEAHGGYTFCSVASLAILGELDKIDLSSLMQWCSQKQYEPEKGLSGRTNKLVDGCYSFWVGGAAAILELYGHGECIDKLALRKYILYCCQSGARPGLRDKPGTHPDLYHTNYVLLGLAITENLLGFSSDRQLNPAIKPIPISVPSRLSSINPIYGLPVKDFEKFTQHFRYED
ncbi:hypothetical protein HG536_0A02950 [Torulaspora globosa]|uniref:Protein farnesyltransferase subunit beta n=1 Tax=Torulaspora globosa TaxID=48254 RepID=A0A7G3ZAE2_9SACH|nr:uncharacterized protein HG536_0A02950 [Torulaspora globosa]QLL30478.1 hypothetical protein HG536_0A02950 [Torulaspora globosa]